LAANDYYATLGVERSASAKEVKRAYRAKAMKLHPDQNPDDPQAEEKFKELGEAYAILSDPDRRQQYDRFGHTQFRQQFDVEDIFRGTDFSSIFNNLGFGADVFGSIFSGGAGGGTRSSGFHPGQVIPGQDYRMQIEVTFNEAALGGQRKVAFRAHDGRELAVTVKIPAGISSGQTIRLRGKGLPSPQPHGPAGDLMLDIKVAPHPQFSRKGADLYVTVKTSISTLALGGTVSVPTLDGDKKIRVKEASQSGTQQRLRGLGAAKRNGERGALFVTLKPEFPGELTDEQRTLFESLREQGL